MHFRPDEAPLVLVVDDYADGRELTTQYLRAHGFRVAEAATGRQAIEAATVMRPDLVLVDLVLPDQDGWSVISRLRESDDTKTIKVALHTASVTLDVRERAREQAVDMFLPRPCDLDQLACQLAFATGWIDHRQG